MDIMILLQALHHEAHNNYSLTTLLHVWLPKLSDHAIRHLKNKVQLKKETHQTRAK